MKSKIPLLSFQNLLSFCLCIEKFFFWSINVFLFHYRNYLHINKSIINNDFIIFKDSLYVRYSIKYFILFTLYSKGGYFNYISISHIKKMRLREIKLIVKHHIESMFKSVSDTKVHAFSTVLNAPYSWQIIFLLFHLLSNFTYILMLVSF